MPTQKKPSSSASGFRQCIRSTFSHTERPGSCGSHCANHRSQVLPLNLRSWPIRPWPGVCLRKPYCTVFCCRTSPPVAQRKHQNTSKKNNTAGRLLFCTLLGMGLFSCSAPLHVSKRVKSHLGLEPIIQQVTMEGGRLGCRLLPGRLSNAVYLSLKFQGNDSGRTFTTSTWVTVFTAAEHDSADYGLHDTQPQEGDECLGLHEPIYPKRTLLEGRKVTIANHILWRIKQEVAEVSDGSVIPAHRLENAIAALLGTITSRVWDSSTRGKWSIGYRNEHRKPLGEAVERAIARERLVSLLARFAEQAQGRASTGDPEVLGQRLAQIDRGRGSILSGYFSQYHRTRPESAAKDLQDLCRAAVLNRRIPQHASASICAQTTRRGGPHNGKRRSDLEIAALWYHDVQTSGKFWRTTPRPWIQDVTIHVDQGVEKQCVYRTAARRSSVVAWVIPLRMTLNGTHFATHLGFFKRSLGSSTEVSAYFESQPGAPECTFDHTGRAAYRESIHLVPHRWQDWIVKSVHGKIPAHIKGYRLPTQVVSDLVALKRRATELSEQAGPLQIEEKNRLLEEWVGSSRWEDTLRTHLEDIAQGALAVATSVAYLEARIANPKEPFAAHASRTWLQAAEHTGRSFGDMLENYQAQGIQCPQVTIAIRNAAMGAQRRGWYQDMPVGLLDLPQRSIPGLGQGSYEASLVVSFLCQMHRKKIDPFEELSRRLGVPIQPYGAPVDRSPADGPEKPPSVPIPEPEPEGHDNAALEKKIQETFSRYSQYLVPLRDYERHSLARQTAVGRETDPDLRRCVPKLFSAYKRCMRQNENQPLCSTSAKDALAQCLAS